MTRGNIARNDLFVDAVEAIYGSAAQPANWPCALQALADVFEDVGANLIWRRDDGGFGIIVSPPLMPFVEEWNKWQHVDIRALRAVGQINFNRLDVVTDRHLMTAREIEEHPIYTEFLVPRGLGWAAAARVSPDPALDVWVSVQRAKAKGPFSDEELETLGHLASHTEQSLRLSMRLLDAELSKLGLGEALARVGIGVFALDSLKRVVFANPAAERLLGDGIKIAADLLCVSAPSEHRALDAAVEEALRVAPERDGGPFKPILIRRERSQRPLTVYVLPITAQSPSHTATQFLTHARAIVLVIDPQADAPADPAVVRDLLGVTLGEARVAALVGSGLTPKAAAERLGIAEETARVLLKRTFSKVGVSRQSELAALLTKLVLR